MLSGRAASWIAVAALLGLAALAIVLSAALPTLTLTEGSPFEGRAVPGASPRSSGSSDGGSPRAFVKLLAFVPMAVFAVAVALYAWSMRHRGDAQEGGPPRRRTRWGAVVVMLFIIPVLFFARSRLERTYEGEADAAVAEETLAEEEPGVDVFPTTLHAGTGETPAGEASAAARLLEILLAVVAVGTSAILLAAAWRLRKARPAPEPPTPPALEETLDHALRGLAQGRDAAGIVIDCYREMMNSFAASSGVDPRALTPREFARSLATRGLGGAALEELTNLFELVRYGRRPDDDLAPRALSCMTELRERLAALAPAPAV